MSGRPWLASTTSGAFGPDTASFRVVLRLVNDFATRLIVTFGYLAWNSAFSRWICLFWPPRTSWSQTVSVTFPALATSARAARSDGGGVFFALPPGVAPQAAASAA